MRLDSAFGGFVADGVVWHLAQTIINRGYPIVVGCPLLFLGEISVSIAASIVSFATKFSLSVKNYYLYAVKYVVKVDCGGSATVVKLSALASRVI